jgi:hypothetical protein
VGSKTFDGVRFIAWSLDHDPPHVHGRYAGVELIVELKIAERTAAVANRQRNPKPHNAKKSDVAYILKAAAVHFDELVKLWEEA